MLFSENTRLPDGRFLPAAGCAWLAGAGLLLPVAALAANVFKLGELGLGYLSSAVSFLAAAIAGVSAIRRHPAAKLPISLLTATVLVIALLTVGFLIKGEEMNSSAILSIVSFTYAGVIFGAFIQPGRKRTRRIRH